MEALVENIRNLSLQFVPFMMAVVFHEYAHGFVAKRFGDLSAQKAGRLTLNPLPHIDILGTLIFPLFMMIAGVNILFGWAKPVPINPLAFRKFRAGIFWVASAGPLMNFLLAVVSAALYCAILKFMPSGFFLFDPLRGMTQISIYLNFALGIFNLIPIPPLDGSKILESFLSYEALIKYEKLSQYSFFIMLALLFSGALKILVIPINIMAHVTLGVMFFLFGLGS